MATKLKIRRPLMITENAHKELPRLCSILAQERGVSSVSMIDAASIAIKEALERRQAEKKEAVK